MTPSLMGRWQTRLWLMTFLGLPISALFAYLYRGAGERFTTAPLYMLGYVLLFGFVWDVLYQFAVTHTLWDYDWPAAYQLVAGGIEGVLVYLLIRFTGLPGITKGAVGLGRFWLAYGTIWLVTYTWVFFFMRALFIRWRFRAGQFGKFPLPR